VIGKSEIAPCGHLGEHVLGGYVACTRCDKAAVPEYIELEITEPVLCRHVDLYVWAGMVFCYDCGRRTQ
jgi:hypothetical protein